MKGSKEKYSRLREYYEGLIKKQSETVNFLSLLRIIIFVSGLGFSAFLFAKKHYYTGGSVFITFIITFSVLVMNHRRVKGNRLYSHLLYIINDNSLKRLNDEWQSFGDTGKEFQNKEHNYTDDLDIFGQCSLFQLINTGSTFYGRQKLKEFLAATPELKENICSRQQAVEELSKKFGWRQRFEAEGMAVSEEMKNPEELLQWTLESNGFYLKTWVLIIFRIIPVITSIIIILPFITQLPYYISMAAIIINMLILRYGKGKRQESLSTVFKYRDNIKSYYRMIKHVEGMKFKSKYLIELKKRLVNEEGIFASKQIKRFDKIADMVAEQRSSIYPIINILTLWDYQCEILLQLWKKKCGRYLKECLEVIGELEALSSLAVLGYDHPDWTFPEFVEDMELVAKEISHPLLPEERVSNELRIDNGSGILLITGSNMSGKSTLLRTAGINLVLAYAGAPVCAKSFRCSIMNIYSCMRISDNLENNISSFYAEILRIKNIVKAVNEHKRVFFLLDEIFRGTNSMDRHTGASILIKKLYNAGAIGLVSTHDLELCDLEKENSHIKNYHFREYYKDNQIHFDYKLRLGTSTTRNAIYLMKMAGIDIE